MLEVARRGVNSLPSQPTSIPKGAFSSFKEEVETLQGAGSTNLSSGPERKTNKSFLNNMIRKTGKSPQENPSSTEETINSVIALFGLSRYLTNGNIVSVSMLVY